MTRRRKATTAPPSARNRARHKAAALFVASSDDAHASWPPRRPQPRAKMARPGPAAGEPAPSSCSCLQYRLGFRWRGQVADEDDLDNRKRAGHEHGGGDDLGADGGFSDNPHDGMAGGFGSKSVEIAAPLNTRTPSANP